MGKWVHRLSDINEVTRTATCAACGPIGIRRKGSGLWRCCVKACQYPGRPDRPSRLRARGKQGGYRKFKKGSCERCGFEPEHKCQLDVHHIDGDHENSAPENLQTLCANCHRLVTELDREAREGATV